MRGLGNESADIHRSASGRTLLAGEIELVDRGALGSASDQRGDLALGHAAKVGHRTGVCSMCSRSCRARAAATARSSAAMPSSRARPT